MNQIGKDLYHALYLMVVHHFKTSILRKKGCKTGNDLGLLKIQFLISPKN